MRKMQCFGNSVAIFAKGECKGKTADNQMRNAYPSFIVRLSFVIRSFNLRSFFRFCMIMLVVKCVDY